MKILFLLKRSKTYGSDYSSDYSSNYSENQVCNETTEYYCENLKSGLYNSARLVSDFISKLPNMKSNVISCIDGNDVDNKLYKYTPDICIIEAIWITPSKIIELQKLYPKIKFIIRVHSKIPFLAMEGIAITWIKEYVKIENVKVSFNNDITHKDMNSIGIENIYLPNIYEDIKKQKKCFNFFKLFSKNKIKDSYNIGCFGAIRPLKNQLNQAVAAIKFGNENNTIINFYVNYSRLEQTGENVYKNIKALFNNTKHNLIDTKWLNREEFLNLLSKMDISMQVSLTETFNIVAADSVFVNVPVVVSKEINWLSTGISDPNNVESICKQMKNVLKNKNKYIRKNLMSLKKYNDMAIYNWLIFLNNYYN